MSSSEGERSPWHTPNLPDAGRMESDLRVEEHPEYEQIRRITYDDNEDRVELTTGLPGDFSGKKRMP